MQNDTSVISDAYDLPPLLDILVGLPVDPPSLYFDLEGVNLGRFGSISLVLLHVAPHFTTYIIDIHMLGAAAFSTKNNNGASLKNILVLIFQRGFLTFESTQTLYIAITAYVLIVSSTFSCWS